MAQRRGGGESPRPASSRGRVPTRSVAEIIDAAVALADRDGLAAVTMRAVAASLGTGAASLYRYVETRDQLIALMVDMVNREFDLGRRDRLPWDDQLMDLAHQARGIYRRHPWMVTALDATPVLGPHGLAYLDHALAVLEPTGADGRTRLEAVAVLGALVRLLSRQEVESTTGESLVDGNSTSLQVAGAAASGSYPHLAAALDNDEALGDQFDRILRRVLGGLIAPTP